MKNELARAYNLGAGFNSTRINISENQTYRIDDGGKTYALRLARPGYHTRQELNSELAWLQAIKDVPTAKPIRGQDQQFVQEIAGHHAVLFAWVEGVEPQITDNLASLAEHLGTIAAQLHEHALAWQRPATFTRPRWDFAASLGHEMRWGDWRNGLGVEPKMWPLLATVINQIETKLKAYGQSPQRFNLIHGDLRLANLLQKDGKLTVIDFDDCGFGWLMYDAATMISFHENEPQAGQMIQSWIKGYSKVKPLSAEDEAIIPTLIMFRRILLLAWLGSHSEIELAQQLRDTFADQTLQLCKAYLAR